MAPSASKVFISYNRADRDWAEWIAGVIKRAGYEPILDVWHFRPGENFVLRMHEAAMEANLTLAVLSEGYLQAAYTQPEWAAAFAPDPTGKDRRLIPVRVSKCTPTGILRSILYIDLIELNEQNAQQALLNGLTKTLRRAGAASQVPRRTQETNCRIGSLSTQSRAAARRTPAPAALSATRNKPCRAEAEAACRRWKRGHHGAILGRGFCKGMGGIGKTVLAAALAYDSKVRLVFSDGIYLVNYRPKAEPARPAKPAFAPVNEFYADIDHRAGS